MSVEPVCPNGHDVERVIAVPCEQCEALVLYEPVAAGMRLHELLGQAATLTGQLEALVWDGINLAEHLIPYVPGGERARYREEAAEIRRLLTQGPPR